MAEARHYNYTNLSEIKLGPEQKGEFHLYGVITSYTEVRPPIHGSDASMSIKVAWI